MNKLKTKSIFTVPPQVDKNGNLLIIDKNIVICLNSNDEAENKLYVVIKDKFVQGYDLNAGK